MDELEDLYEERLKVEGLLEDAESDEQDAASRVASLRDDMESIDAEIAILEGKEE